MVGLLGRVRKSRGKQGPGEGPFAYGCHCDAYCDDTVMHTVMRTVMHTVIRTVLHTVMHLYCDCILRCTL